MGFVYTDLQTAGGDPLRDVVILEDADGLRGQLAKFLHQKGLAVHSPDAVELLELTRERPVGLVILDLMFSEENSGENFGFEAIDRLSTRHPKAEIVILTAHAGHRPRDLPPQVTIVEKSASSKESLFDFLADSLTSISPGQESLSELPHNEHAQGTSSEGPGMPHKVAPPLDQESLAAHDGGLSITRLMPAAPAISALLKDDIRRIYGLSAEEFELFICGRLESMGMVVQRTGHVYTPDGGVDIVAWPKNSALPFLLAVQAKHHTRESVKTGPADVRQLQAVVQSLPFHGGLLVTSTSFTPEAIWWAKRDQPLIRLRDLSDIRRWLDDSYGDDEWRDMPKFLELGSNIRLPLNP